MTNLKVQMSNEGQKKKYGMMEHWNIGFRKKDFHSYALFQHSIIPE